MPYIQLADCVEETIMSYSRIIAKIGAQNDVGLVFDEFKKATTDAVDGLDADYYYLSIASWGSSSRITASVKSSDEVLEALNWFRKRGWKSTEFTDDGDSQTRSYTLKNKDSENEITFEAYFGGGTCEFVPTTKRRHIPAVKATAGKYVPIMELKCDGVALPTE